MLNETAERGYTLVELLMVILIIGTLSAVVLPQFIDFKSDAAKAVTQEKLRALKMAITGDPRTISNGKLLQPGYVQHMGRVPQTLEELRTQGSQPTYDPFRKSGWRGPYVTTTDPDWNLDGWSVPLEYDAGARTVKSCGPNSVCGDSDDISISF